MKRFAIFISLCSWLMACGGGSSDSDQSLSPNTNAEIINESYEASGYFSSTSKKSNNNFYFDIIPLPSMQKGMVVELYMFGAPLAAPLTTIVSDEEYIDPYLLLKDSEGNDVASDDDSGLDYDAYIKLVIPETDDYVLIVSSADEVDMGYWKLNINFRNEKPDENYFKYDSYVDQDDDSSDSDDDDTCHSKNCPQCYRFEYSTCSCRMRLDYSVCKDHGWN